IGKHLDTNTVLWCKTLSRCLFCGNYIIPFLKGFCTVFILEISFLNPGKRSCLPGFIHFYFLKMGKLKDYSPFIA
ncbi:MAG: hypothetical protein ACI4FN_03240, partial [Acutalibacteraceae bacterium]